MTGRPGWICCSEYAGGSIAAAESLVEYLHAMFGGDIRAIVPQIAESAGTMIACACREIVMGAHSSLGPIDPQLHGLPAHGVVEEFKRAADEIRSDPARIPLWQPIIAKYHPTLIGECDKAMAWSNQIVERWLAEGMLANEVDPTGKAKQVVQELGQPSLTLSHERRIGIAAARRAGLRVTSLEDDQALQDAVLTVHASIQTLTDTAAVKLIENQNGVAFIQNINIVAAPALPAPAPSPAAPLPPPQPDQ